MCNRKVHLQDPSKRCFRTPMGTIHDLNYRQSTLTSRGSQQYKVRCSRHNATNSSRTKVPPRFIQITTKSYKCDCEFVVCLGSLWSWCTWSEELFRYHGGSPDTTWRIATWILQRHASHSPAGTAIIGWTWCPDRLTNTTLLSEYTITGKNRASVDDMSSVLINL